MAENRTPRASTTREKDSRRKPWKPPSTLDAPPAPEGYVHRWIRAEVMGKDDSKNMSARLREGFELVRADEYPDFQAPQLLEGKNKGVIAVGGLLLARFPIESKEERDSYYRNRTQQQIDSIDNDLFAQNDPRMPLQRPDRQSRVTFGGPREGE